MSCIDRDDGRERKEEGKRRGKGRRRRMRKNARGKGSREPVGGDSLPHTLTQSPRRAGVLFFWFILPRARGRGDGSGKPKCTNGEKDRPSCACCDTAFRRSWANILKERLMHNLMLIGGWMIGQCLPLTKGCQPQLEELRSADRMSLLGVKCLRNSYVHIEGAFAQRKG